ncbi:MAG: prephenate dehydrogenase [Ignavibacteriales bacterium]|nr:prephenate dehydrogenase [Ignavibacteriales bacterium]
MNSRLRIQSSFKRITIIGVGVIGGSLGLAIKKHYPDVRIVGVDKGSVLGKALKRGAIDEAATDLRKALSGSDLVFLATPVSVIQRVLPKVAAFAPSRTVVTDVGSVKRSIMRRASRLFPYGNFIGGHPMAGVELSGVDAAHPLLFENAVYVLSPMKSTPPLMMQQCADFLKELGARIVLLDPDTHDEVASVVSHLPQLTAVALTNVAGKEHRSGRRHLRLAAGGFRDLTRIASSRPEIWKDILEFNRDEIDKSLVLLIRELERYRTYLRKGTTDLAARFRSARTIRDGIPKSMKGFLHPLAELYVFVKDKPGMMAKMTSVLAKAEINIKDIELVKVREGRGGTFRLAFESKEMSARAVVILKKAGFEIGD